jgi:hypothetical protein
MALVAVVLPVAIAVVAIALQLAWLPSLPEQIATHWSFADVPDGFGPAWTSPALVGGITLLASVLGGLLIVRATPADGPSVTQKLLAAVILGLVALISTMTSGTLAIQLPGGTGADGGVLPIVLGSVGAAVALGVVGWFATPRTNVVAPEGRPAAPVAVSAGEQVAWIGTAAYGLPMLLGLIGLVIAGLGLSIYLLIVTGIWFMLLIPVVLGLALLGTGWWRVRADADGLTVRGLLGRPLYRVPLGTIQSAGTIAVTPLGEFGGWGIRFGRGRRLGIITRSGEALEVQLRDGRAIVVTVDDAATAAGVLTALAARSGKG